MIILQFHLQLQVTYELFHVYFTNHSLSLELPSRARANIRQSVFFSLATESLANKMKDMQSGQSVDISSLIKVDDKKSRLWVGLPIMRTSLLLNKKIEICKLQLDTSSETQGLLVRMMPYFRASNIFGQNFPSRHLFLPNQFQKCS